MKKFSTDKPSFLALNGPEDFPAEIDGREVVFFKPSVGEAERFMGSLSRQSGTGDIWDASRRLVEHMLSDDSEDDNGLTDYNYVQQVIEETGRLSLWQDLAGEALEEFIGRPLAQSSGSRAQRRRAQRSSPRTSQSSVEAPTTTT